MNNQINWVELETSQPRVDWLEFPLNRTFYEVLGVQNGASPEEMRTAYRRLVFLYHPDRNPETKKSWAEFMTAELNIAYATLSDPEKKAAYDRQPVVR
jgi:DnaJ-class molecular chaperone